MSTFIDRLIAPPRLGASEVFAREMILSTRLAVVAARRDSPPLSLLERRTGDAALAAHFLHLTQVVAAAWPDRFALAPPCCRTLSPDEALLAQLADAAMAMDLPRFVFCCRDMLDGDARERLWQALCALAEDFRALHRGGCAVMPPRQP